MITLFDYLPSQNAWKVRLLLTQLGLPYEQKFVRIFDGEGQSDEYLRISPRGTVPAILLSDGRALAESNVILSYLAEGSAFLPGDPYDKAKVLQWLMFEATYVQPSIAFLRFVKLTRAAAYPAKALDWRISLGYRALDAMNDQLQRTGFIAGDQYTIADMSLYAYTHLAEDAGIQLKAFPHFQAWLARVREQPGFGPPVHPYSLDPSSTKDLPSFRPWRERKDRDERATTMPMT
jgi:glutathione S-transferase